KEGTGSRSQRQDCALCWRGKKTHPYRPGLPTLCEIRGDHKSVELLICKLPFQHLGEKWPTTSKQICASRVQLLVLCRRQVRTFWGSFLRTPTCVLLSLPTCHSYAKRRPASAPRAWRTCLRIHRDGKHFIL
ncbi:unnamed protein product, partial [Gulo gulo]